jgi:hypothetical protein
MHQKNKLLQETDPGKREILAWIATVILFRVGCPASSYLTNATCEFSRARAQARACWARHLKLPTIGRYHQPSEFVGRLSSNPHLKTEN